MRAPTFAIVLGSMMSMQALASIPMDDIKVAGTGCKDGNVYVQETSDGVQLLFNDLYVETGDGNRSINRKACNLAIPAQVPDGKRMVIEEATLVGISYLDKQSESKINVSTHFAGETAETVSESNTKKGLKFSYLENSGTISSNCGQDVIVRAKASATLKGKSGYNLLYLSKLKLNYHLEDC